MQPLGMHSVIILKAYKSSLCNHILHELRITRYLLQSFYQKDIDRKWFQDRDKTPVFTILRILQQSLRKWWWLSRNRDHFLGYLCFFYRFIHQSPLVSTTLSSLLISSSTTHNIGGSIVCLPF